uniref:carbonic anhydrase n=1 Tax=Exaiptasia diaphana TaxID=2652724 RepID=A0A1B0Y2E3_EXADI|nr:alpha carbonic anhydrase 5 [Exaiptasia diaphana]
MATPEWDYDKKGPSDWHNHYPAASGKRQSPIDINTADAKYDSSLKPLSMKYSPDDDFQVVNNGRSVTISKKKMTGHQLSGGPLEHRYRFEQFHFHWGKTSEAGSEHLTDSKAFPAELHLVHWNTELFKSFGDAATKNKGLAVLGFFVQIGEDINPGLKTITDFLPQVENIGEKKDFKGSFNLESLLAGNTKDYWTYDGSLTTPPCAESVTWFVFKTPIQATEEQMKQFRNLKESDTERLCDNYRPVLPLNGRVVKSSFK